MNKMKFIFAKSLTVARGNAKLLKAFTLAEVLITLLIIGVVASMTIPALMQKTQDQELKTAWKKEYSVINNAFNLILNENGGSIKGYCNEVNDADGNCILDLFKQKLNVQKLCEGNAQTNCYIPYSQVKNLAGTSGQNIMNVAKGMVLTDGSFISPALNDTNCKYKTRGTKTYCGYIMVDVNGIKPPNTQGKDIFWIFVDENKVWPAGMVDDDAYDDGGDHSCSTAGTGASYEGLGCSALYLQQ